MPVPAATETTLSRRQVEALGRIAEQHRQRPLEDDEDLLLHELPVAPAARARREAPEARPRLGQRAGGRDVGDAAGRSALEVRALLPVVLVAAHDLKAHGAILSDRAASAQWFAAFGVAVEVTVKSDAFAFVSWPSGSRTMLEPGAAVDGGAAAAAPSTSAFVAVPQPTLSTSAPVASRTPTPPPVPASPVLNDWSAVAVPA